MRKILLSTVALLMAVSMMAIGNNSGTSKANAIDFDWANGNIHEASTALWYRVDLSSLEATADPTLALYLTNLTSETANVHVDVTVSASGLSRTESLDYTIAGKDHKPWSRNVKDLMSLGVKDVFLTVKSDKKIAIAAKVYETEDIVDDACTKAVDFNWAGQNVPAGEKWFRLNIAAVPTNQQLDFVVTNNGAQTANVAFDLSLDCPASAVMENDWVIASGAEQRKDFGRVFLDMLNEDYVYLKLTTDQDLTLAVEQTPAPTYTGFDCSAAKPLVVGETLNLTKGEHVYVADVNDLVAPINKLTVFTVTNLSATAANLKTETAFACPVTSAIEQNFVVEANASVIKDVNDNILKTLNAEKVYIRFTAEEDMQAEVSMIDNYPCSKSVVFDWSTGVTHHANTSAWYEIDMTPVVEGDKSVKLSFTNHSSEMALVTGELMLGCPGTSIPVVCPVPAGLSVEKVINANFFAASKIQHAYLSISSTATIELKSELVEVALDPACKHATTIEKGKELNQNPGSAWYRVTDELVNGLGMLPKFTFQNKGEQAAHITLAFTLDCDYDILTQFTVTVPTWLDVTTLLTSIPEHILDKLLNKNVSEYYVKVTTDQPLLFGFELDHANYFGCDNATNFDWANGTTIPANDAKWYKFDVTDLKNNEEQVKLTFTNTSSSIAWVAAFLTHECPFTVGLPLVFPVPAGMSVDKWLDYSFIASTPLNTVYMAVYTDSNIQIKAEKETAVVTPMADCLGATEVLPNVQYTIQPGTNWYKFSATPFINATGKSATLSFANKSGKTAHVTTGATVGCEYGILTRGKLPVPAMDLNLNVPLWVFGVMKKFVDERVDQYYVEVTTDQALDFQIQVELAEDTIPETPEDTVPETPVIPEDSIVYLNDTINMYACAGSYFVHPVTADSVFLAEDSIFMSIDTLHTADVLLDSVITTIVTPYVIPQLLDSATLDSILGAYPVLTPGVKPTLPTDTILNYYASIDQDSIADVVAVEWLSGKVACGAKTHTVTLQIETSCEGAYTKSFVMPVDTAEVIKVDSVICFGDTVVWETYEFATTGQHTKSLTNIYGFDSVVYELNLTVLPKVQTIANDTIICYGESFTWRNTTCDATKLYTDTVLNQLGCDSLIYTMNVTVLPNVVELPAEDTTLCYGESITWREITCNEAKTYYDTVYSKLTGCDSLIYTLNVSILAEVTLPKTDDVKSGIIVICGNAIDVTAADATVKAYVAAVTSHPTLENVIWEVKNAAGNWETLTTTAIDGTVTSVEIRYTIQTACEDVTSDPIVITVQTPTPENDEEMTNIPLYSRYGDRLLTVDLKKIQDEYGWVVAEEDITWYYVAQGAEPVEVGHGYYLTPADGAPLNAGSYYARINHEATEASDCDGILQTVTYIVNAPSAAPKLVPTVARPQELISVLNLDPASVTAITIYSTTGEVITSFQVNNQEQTTFPAAQNAGFYVVDVQTATEKVSLRYIVK